MKFIYLFMLPVCLSLTTLAQQQETTQINTSTPNIPDETILSTSNVLVNNYKTALRNAVNCNRDFDFRNYIVDNMSEDATIEVSNTRNHRKKSYPAIKYFSQLRSLVCSDTKAYDSIKFSFTNFPLRDTCIHQDYSNHYIVRVRLGQTFSAFNKTTMTYSDYTIKIIVIDFGPGRRSTYNAKIVKVLIENENPE